MAKTKTLSIADMTTGNVADETALYFVVMPKEFAIANGVVADPDNVTSAEKVFVQTRFKVANDLDATIENQNAEWEQASAANFPTLSAGFLADLKKIYDAQRTTLGLDPA